MTLTLFIILFKRKSAGSLLKDRVGDLRWKNREVDVYTQLLMVPQICIHFTSIPFVCDTSDVKLKELSVVS